MSLKQSLFSPSFQYFTQNILCQWFHFLDGHLVEALQAVGLGQAFFNPYRIVVFEEASPHFRDHFFDNPSPLRLLSC